jgi:3-deoxy-D-manno-octulosonic-acid transferase
MKPFTLLYFILGAVLYVAALPLLAALAFKRKYRESIPARFFLRRNPPFTPGGIWFHACSGGETRALKPLLDRLRPGEVRISTITQTGQKVAEGYGTEHRYLPYELFLPWWVRRHAALVVLEAEFWYMLFTVARARGAEVILLNARISERSFPKYRRLGWFYRRLFAQVHRVYAQSDADRERLEALGARHVEVIGNIKLAQTIEATRRYDKPAGETIVAASTHEGEEEAVLDAFLHYRASHPEARLLVVPRHPERFDAVWELVREKGAGLKLGRWSETGASALEDGDIVLVDAMGELNNLYALSDTAVLGGAFRDDVGGHNPLEPAHFGCRIVTGRHFFNQKELMRYVEPVHVCEPDALADALETARGMEPARITGSVDLGPVIEHLNTLTETETS